MKEFEIDPLNVTFEPLAGSTFTNLLRLFAQNRFKIGLIGMPRAMYSTVLSLALSPLSVYEKLTCDKKINQTKLEKPPIFILGHWRSGTTYLHNLMTQNQQFAYPTTLQTVAPAIFLKFDKLIKPLVESSLPPTRPQDNIEIGADLPQEDEYGIGNLSPYSYYNGWCFPDKLNHYYSYVHMENGTTKKTIDEWKKIYLYYIKKVSLYHKNKQLILKNPSNTARIKLLLELFPDAKFIHIYRNPYHTYMSMSRMIHTEMPLYCVQTPKNKDMFEDSMIELYNIMFKKYFKESKLIPNGNLVEVQYETLIEKPVETIKQIHEKLKLTGFTETQKRLKEYIDSQKKIKTHKYKIDEHKKEKIYKNLKMTIDTWGYNQ